MKKIIIIMLFVFNTINGQVRIFENESYKFVQKDSLYELSTKFDVEYDFNYIPKRSRCNIISQGRIFHDNNEFYYLRSELIEPTVRAVLKEAYYDKLNGDSISVIIKIPKFYKIDYENFYLVGNGVKRYDVIEKNEETVVKYKFWNASNIISLILYPNNTNYLVTDNPLSILEFELLKFNILGRSENQYFFEIENFNPCDLYSIYFQKEYIKIKNNKLSWKDEVLEAIR